MESPCSTASPSGGPGRGRGRWVRTGALGCADLLSCSQRRRTLPQRRHRCDVVWGADRTCGHGAHARPARGPEPVGIRGLAGERVSDTCQPHPGCATGGVRAMAAGPQLRYIRPPARPAAPRRRSPPPLPLFHTALLPLSRAGMTRLQWCYQQWPRAQLGQPGRGTVRVRYTDLVPLADIAGLCSCSPTPAWMAPACTTTLCGGEGGCPPRRCRHLHTSASGSPRLLLPAPPSCLTLVPHPAAPPHCHLGGRCRPRPCPACEACRV